MEDIDVQFLVFYFEDEIFIFIIFGSIGKLKMVLYFYIDYCGVYLRKDL